ncbi:MAG: hypothetical protein QF830_02300 [Rhodospirillales bacterium]|nr:hypothetical protein [Rhodospirillales bacterium]
MVNNNPSLVMTNPEPWPPPMRTVATPFSTLLMFFSIGNLLSVTPFSSSKANDSEGSGLSGGPCNTIFLNFSLAAKASAAWAKASTKTVAIPSLLGFLSR